MMSQSTNPLPENMQTPGSLTKHRDTYPFIDPFRFRGKLTGKVVLVTYAHRGLGRATALAFASAGASVCCVGPTAPPLDAIIGEIKAKHGTPAIALTSELRRVVAATQVVAMTAQHLGPVDILVNITPPLYLRPFADEPDLMQDWWPTFEQLLRVPIALIHAALPAMVARQAGTIITLTDMTAGMHVPFTSAQGVASAALLKFHHQMHLETAAKGIFWYAVNPGPVPSLLHDPASSIRMDPTHLSREPALLDQINTLTTSIDWAAVGLASGTFVMLCAEPRAAVLRGLLVNAERDLGELITVMESIKGMRKVKRDRLYVLKIDEL